MIPIRFIPNVSNIKASNLGGCEVMGMSKEFSNSFPPPKLSILAPILVPLMCLTEAEFNEFMSPISNR